MKLKLRISKVDKNVAILEDLIEKTSGETMGTLVDEIRNHVESVIDARAEAELIINRAESVATLDTNAPTTNLLSPVSTTVSNPSVDSIYRVPAVQLPRFDGKHEEWPSFADSFQSVIGDNPALRDIQKFAYLKSCLSGPAAEKIRVLEITADNYPIAWKTLVECYDNPLILINKHVRAILEGPPIDSEFPSSLIAASDALSANYRALVATKKVFVDQFAIAAHLSRMDPATRLQWEQRYSRDALPTVDEFVIFLRDQGNALVNSQPAEHSKRINNSRRNAPLGPERNFRSRNLMRNEPRFNSPRNWPRISDRGQVQAYSTSATVSCGVCRERHNTSECERYCEPSPRSAEESWLTPICVVIVYKLVTAYTHVLRMLLQCSGGHHELLRSNGVGGAECTCRAPSLAAPALLLTAVVHLLDRDGRPHECRVLLDSGSEAHFLTIRLPSQRIPQEELIIPAGIQLAVPKFYEPANIDAILGVEIFASLWRAGQSIRLNENLMAQGTVLGWLVMSTGNTRTPQSVNCHTATVDLNSQLEKFWKIEEVAESSIRSHEENLCEAHYRSNTRRDDTGRYIVRLPFKEENQLGDSYTSALRRFHALERSLSRKPKIRDEYIKFLSEYEELGHMTRIEGGPHEDRFYLPHHAVLKHTSITTKLRVVFDASAKTSNGKSLNNVLMVGPTIQEDLFALLVRFRSHAIAITADIAKMYRQIIIDPRDRKYQTILWRRQESDPVKTYRLNTVTYGTASASFLATRTLHQLASDEFDRFPRAAIALKEDFYVDDLLTGARTVREAKQVRDELISITAGAGMHLRQWASNCAEILKDLDTADNNIINLDSSETIKTLGVNWNAAEDNIGYTVKRAADPSKVTKRVILSEISQLFDPLGLLGPVVINAKLMMQRLWQLKSTWDEDVPADIYKIWQEFRQNLHTLEEIRFARNVAGDGEEMEMHGFCDASERAYGACIYVKTLGKNPTLRLVCAKSKVAPLKTQSLPRLELCGALILSRLFKATKNALRRNDFCRTIFWTDSTVVLHWLNTPPHTLKTYVAHRVAEIQESTARELWRHVSSEHNPADLISRGVTPAELRESKLWKSGPAWLIQPESNWPHSRLEPIEIPEKKRIVTHARVATPFELFRRYSSFVKLKRIIAYCVRFARNSRNLKEKRIMGELTVDELKGAEIIAIRLIQEEAFPEIIKLIKSGKEVCASFSVLSPFVDNLGILRVGGRLARSNLPYEQRHPALLPKDHTITNAIIREKHHQIGHGGTQATLNALRESFWPISGRSSVKRVIYKCITCRRLKPATPQYPMSDLPASRLLPNRPFIHTGVDFCGPLFIKERQHRNRGRAKIYVAVFVCFSTKAVHLELVNDLTTEAFLAALRRFMARRGKCSDIYSDNATNFVGAANELEARVSRSLVNEGIKWHFIPPRSPHFGGLWEAAVKSFKYHLVRIIGETLLSYEALLTYVLEIEAILNSRPITPLSNDPNDLRALTPGHFLIGNSFTSLPEDEYRDIPSGRLSQWQHVQQMRQHFWNRWNKEYLNEQTVRKKWHRGTADKISPGTLVILREDNSPPLKWSLGRIAEVHKGADGIARVASVKTANGLVKRGIKRLSPLPSDL
ncbi:uncharacterized protein LOC122520399 [Polistes fuscatus]|uniref:uncharacterized protein LOC122520399 n=3 Tax=Polistes fuscatus TaxID=30207 RepID=UPI001CAA196C|nr:uncharacterized protein LOC122520399 [Polistes fuscatus]